MSPMMWGAPPAGWINGWNVPYGVGKPWNLPYGADENAGLLLKQQLGFEECPQAASTNSINNNNSSSGSSLWAPKTLRIADPVDAARSSIWSTLGLGRPSLASSLSSSSSLSSPPFQAKPDKASVNPMPHSNPAALSRSAVFNENC
jgi:hypothetical protein